MVLLATLTSVILLVGVAVLVQQTALVATLPLKRLTQQLEEDIAIAAVHELLRPLVGEAMIEFDRAPRLNRAGAFIVRFNGHVYSVEAQTDAADGAQPKAVILAVLEIK